MRAFKDARELRSFLPEPDPFPNYRAVLGEGDENPDLVVIKRNPSWYDAQGGKPLLGQDGIPIRRALLKLGVKFYATNAFPFVTPTGKVTAKEAKIAAPVISEELRRVGGKKYLLLGADAARWTPLFKYPFKKHNELLGRNLHVDGNTFRVVHAPMAIANTPALMKDFLQSVSELLDPANRDVPEPPKRELYWTVQNAHQARRILDRMGELVAVDTETTGTDPYTCRLLTIQVSWEEGIGYSFPWELLSPAEWAHYLGTRKLIFQNGQFDVKVLANHGVMVQIHEDTLLMHSIIEETPGTHSMEQMAHKYLGIDKWSDLVNYESMEDNDLRTLGKYGARDTDITLRLANVFRPRVEGRYITKLLHEAQNSIIRSELRGIRVDREKAFQFQTEIEGHLHDLQCRVADMYGLENMNSPKQVLDKLLEMGVPLKKQKGSYSTSEEFIEPFIGDFPIIRDILEYRHLTKAGSTYVKNILKQSERDGRYHPEFKLAATETGRLAESLILLIPRADDLVNPDLGKQYQVRLRELFIADEGHLMIGADYSGLEVAMAAYITGDRQLIEDIKNRLDTHSAVAIQAFNLPIDLEPYETLKQRVTAQYDVERTLAKSGTFAWLYGGDENTIARNLGVPIEVARAILTALKTRYRGVADWHERVIHDAKTHGSVLTPWGRGRRFLFNSVLDHRVVLEQEREAINFPNQAMATDMNLAAFTQMELAGLQTLFPMHDACYLQAPEDKAEAVAKQVVEIMENILQGPVPFRADVKIGRSWADL